MLLSSLIHDYTTLTIEGTPAIYHAWYNNEGRRVASFIIWTQWDGINLSDLEIEKPFRNLGLSSQLLDYAIKELGVRCLTAEKDNLIANHVYKKYGFKIVAEDEKYFYYIWEANASPNFTL